MENQYVTRKRRNINKGQFEQNREIDTFSIDRYYKQPLKEEVYDEVYEEINDEGFEEIEISDAGEKYVHLSADNVFVIDGKPFVPKQIQKKESFQDTHIRITTYLEKNVHQIIHLLHKQGQIKSITKLMNDSVKDYLIVHYQDGNSRI